MLWYFEHIIEYW